MKVLREPSPPITATITLAPGDFPMRDGLKIDSLTMMVLTIQSFCEYLHNHRTLSSDIEDIAGDFILLVILLIHLASVLV